MISLSVPGVELRRLLNLRIKRLEQAIEFLRADVASDAKEREAEMERAELFLKLFPAGETHPDVYMFPRSSAGGVVGGAPAPPVPRPIGMGTFMERQIADHEHAIEIQRWMVARIREGAVYDLDRADLAFFGFGTMAFGRGMLAGV